MFFYLYRSKRILKNSKKNIKYFKHMVKLKFELLRFKIKFNKENLTYDFIYDFFMLFDYILDSIDRVIYTLDTGEIIEVVIYRQNRDRILSRYDSITIKIHDNKHIIESLKIEFKRIKSITCEWYRCSDKKRYVLELFNPSNKKESLELDSRIKKYFIMIFDIIMKGVDDND